MKIFKAENGETLVANDEVQAAAFVNAGLELVESDEDAKEKKTKK